MTYLKGAEFDAVVIILRGQPLTEGHGAQIKRAAERLRDLIEEGLASGPGRRRTQADDRELRSIARGDID